MAIIGTIPRRSVNLPPWSLATLIGRTIRGQVQEGPEREAFRQEMAAWLGVPHVFGAATGRSAFQLALEAMDLPEGSEIVFPAFTFPVMPMVAEILGYRPVFCEVDPTTYNAGPEHVEAVLTENTSAILATHLFGRPCPIEALAELCRARDIRLLEDCAHACGVRVGGRQVGTFGDVGVFSFAQGKNMPCLGGGAIATANDSIAERARAVLEKAPMLGTSQLVKQGMSIWVNWLLTRPWIFALSGYPILRLKQMLGKPLMDSKVGDPLLIEFRRSSPRTRPLANLQAAIGRKQLRRIDAFNAGARENAKVLSDGLQGVSGVGVPPADGDHIYVYYPLGVDAKRRDDLRHFLLRRGIDTKCTDMADCSTLAAFRLADEEEVATQPKEASLLEICVYPVLKKRQMKRIARAIQEWSNP